MTPDMHALSPRILVNETFALAEGPVWFGDRLWWVDINAGFLHSSDADGGNRRSYNVGRKVGAAAPIDVGRFVVAVEDGLGVLDLETAAVRMLASPEQDVPGNRFNDGKCDPAGRFVAGTLSMTGQPKAAALYSVDGKGFVQKIFAPVALSNGLAWSHDGRTLYYIDSLSYEIAAFPYDLRTGQLGNRRVVVRVPKEAGIPDGMTIDEEGNLWVAHWGGWAVRCWSPVTGQCLAEIPMPCACPSCCCFGGPDLDRLFITSAISESPEEREENFAGRVYVCEMPVRGTPVNLFKAAP